MGDIAVPGIEYSVNKTKNRPKYAEKVEKYKKKINGELQIQNEDTKLGTIKTIDVSQIKIRHRHNNRTRKNHPNKRKNSDNPNRTINADKSSSRYSCIYHKD